MNSMGGPAELKNSRGPAELKTGGKMTKFHLYFDKDKETAFLNEMSQKGYAMTGFFAGFYHFDKCEPGEYIYQIDITEGLFRVSNDYREFMKDMDVEIVSLWGPWVILRKKASEGAFELYTDVESNIEHYARIKKMLKVGAVLEIACLFMEIFGAVSGVATAWAFAFILGAILVAMLKELMRVNGILTELKGRIGTDREEIQSGRTRKISGYLAAGFLLNGVALMIPEIGADGQMAFWAGFLKGFLQTVAIVLMTAGCIFTLWRRG